MRRLMLTLMLVSPIQLGHVGVAGEEAGVAAGAVGAAGAGLHLTGTRGGKTTKQIFERREKTCGLGTDIGILGDGHGPDTGQQYLMPGRGLLSPRNRK